MMTDINEEPSFKNGYRDMLYEWMSFFDISYVLKSRTDQKVYKHNVKRNYEGLKKDVLESERVKKTIEQLSGGDKTEEKNLLEKCDEIYKGMAHLLSDNGVRLIAFAAIKVFRAVFKRIYINEESIERLRHLMQEHPVILMPSHRSYFDFVLVTYICFQYNLPHPAIAAAMDFKSMKFMGSALQHAGAFYIRRSFGSDQLYWAIFNEYVHTQLKNGDHPLEFFIEGTRSRTNKSYVPKIGMLTTALESYFKAQVPDVVVVPISVSFERNLEEALYSYELLGIPKPKETTKGLLKARSILSEDYGLVHLHVGEQISVQQFSRGCIDRIYHATKPRYLSDIRPEEKALIKDLAYQVVKQQQRHFAISAGFFVCAVMVQNKKGVSLKHLASQVEWLRRQAVLLDAYVVWPDNKSVEEVVRKKILLHKNIISIDSNDFVTILPPPPSLPKPQRSQVFELASQHLMLAFYRNSICHLFIDVGMVVMIFSVGLKNLDKFNLDFVFREYSFLETLLSRDFIFINKETRSSFEKAFQFLQANNFLSFSHHQNHQSKTSNNENVESLKAQTGDDNLSVSSNGDNTHLSENQEANPSSDIMNGLLVTPSTTHLNEECFFFSRIYQPFIFAYWFYTSSLTLVLNKEDVHDQKQLASLLQKIALKAIEQNDFIVYEVLSLELINNILSSLFDANALIKEKSNDAVIIKANLSVIDILASKIELYVNKINLRFHYSGKSKL